MTFLDRRQQQQQQSQRSSAREAGEQINLRSPRLRPPRMPGRESVPSSVIPEDGSQRPSSGGLPYHVGNPKDAALVNSNSRYQNSGTAAAVVPAPLSRRRDQLDPRFEIQADPARPHRGRGIFATQAVKAGTKVMVARQSAAVPKDKYRAAFCCRCLTLVDKNTLIKCRHCEDRFCGKDCVIAAANEGTREATCAFLENLDGGDDTAAASAAQGRAVVGSFAGREKRGRSNLNITSNGDGGGASKEEIHRREELKAALLAQSENTYAPAASVLELLRLMMECLARRRAGLCSQQEWEEILDLEDGGEHDDADATAATTTTGSGGGGDGAPSEDCDSLGARLNPCLLRAAEEKLDGGKIQVSAEEIQMVYARLRRNFYPVQPEPFARLLPPTAVAVFPAASLVNHSCAPNACFHARRAGPGGPPLEYVLRCMTDVAAGEEVSVSYLAHFATAAKEGRPELLERVWGFSCDCSACGSDVPAGSSSGDWRVTKMLQDMEAILENAQTRSVRETQGDIRCYLEQGLQVLLAGPDISPRVKLQLALRVDEIAIRRRMQGSLRFRSAQELAERLVRSGLDSGGTADLRFTMHREALRWAQDAKLEGSYRRADQMTRASRDSLEEAIKVAVVCLGEAHPKTVALIECLRRFSPMQL